MSKLSFRARALDATKPMPIYMSEELPDLPDFSAINRAVPQMPSGMQKEEECEHHLQRAICAGLIIPTPEVTDMPAREFYDKVYPANYKQPRQLIHMQPLSMEADVPDYDMDSEDERWLAAQASKLDLTALKFEEMMDRLEKSSGQTVVTLAEAKALLKEDDDLIIAVFDYWLNKRLKTQHPLIPVVKTEQRAGAAANNPYLAFRRRTEKMQTRKNRKNDEASYEKMLKLRRDLFRAVTLLELVKRREKIKREYVHLTVEVFEKRYQAGDWSGVVVAEAAASKPRPAFTPIFHNHYPNQNSCWPAAQTPNKAATLKDEMVPRREKRQYKKRKHKGTSHGGRCGTTTVSSDDEATAQPPDHYTSAPTEQTEEQPEDEGPFAFRRNRLCSYHMPLPTMGSTSWPWCSKEENGLADRRFRFALTSLSNPRRCVGFARRRVGRGGRVIIDRVATDYDDLWRGLDFSITDTDKMQPPTKSVNDDLLNLQDERKPVVEVQKRPIDGGCMWMEGGDEPWRTDVPKSDRDSAIVKSDSELVRHSEVTVRTSDFTNDHSAVKVECKREPPDDEAPLGTAMDVGPMLGVSTEDKVNNIDGDGEQEVAFLKALRRDWPHFRPRTPSPGWSPPCYMLPAEEERHGPLQGPFSMEVQPLTDSEGTLVDESPFLSEPFEWGHESPDWGIQQFDTLISTGDMTDASLDLVGCSRFTVRDIGGMSSPFVDVPGGSLAVSSKLRTITSVATTTTTLTTTTTTTMTMTMTTTTTTTTPPLEVKRSEGLQTASANGLLAQFGLDVTSPKHGGTSNGNRQRHTKGIPPPYNFASGGGITLNSHSANAILELPVVAGEAEVSSGAESNDPKSLVRKNNLAMEVT